MATRSVASPNNSSNSALPQIQYIWKCSKCGKTNTNSQAIQVGVKESSVGGAASLTQGNTELRNAYLVMNSSLYKLSGVRGTYAAYRAEKLDAACERCKHKEVWAKASLFEVLNIPMLLLIVISFFGFITALTTGSLPWAELSGGIWAIVLLLYPCLFFFDKYVFRERKNAQLQEASMDSFPVVLMDGEPVANEFLFTDYNPIQAGVFNSFKDYRVEEKNAAIVEEKTILRDKENKDYMYCRKCGGKIPADSVFCPECGEKIIKM